MVKVDLHVHTCYSKDSNLTLEKISLQQKIKGIDYIAITDHNEITGALKYRENELGNVIIGEEIMTSEGEIIGLFLEKKIKPYLSPEETIYEIKNQGGLIYIPHPFDRLRKSTIKKTTLYKIKDNIDLVEIFNSRNIFSLDNEKAQLFAVTNGIKMGVGTDTHTSIEFGNSFIEMEEFDSKHVFLKNIETAKFNCCKSPLTVHMSTKIIKFYKKYFRCGV